MIRNDISHINLNSPVLKTGWERRSSPFSLDIPTAEKLLQPVTHHKIAQLTLCTEGLANTSYQVTFSSHHPPVILRIYLREPAACQREFALHQLLKAKVPVAEMFYIDTSCSVIPYPFAVMEWVEGVLMRDVVLSGEMEAIEACADAAGNHLAILREMCFPHSGFFQEDLSITPFAVTPTSFCLDFLAKPEIYLSLGSHLSAALEQVVESNPSLYPDEQAVNLTHADYDPANILVKQQQGKWKIAAILDWEFAFACSYLLDMGTFLRYSHRLPQCYEQAFCKGIETGKKLPPEWKKSVKLMDIGCLLSLIEHQSSEKSPRLHRDVVSLLQDTVANWEEL